MASFFTAQFVGGMNEVVHPALLDEKTAQLLVNGDISSGKITAIRKPLLLDQSNPESFGHYGTRTRSVIKWYERTYWSNNDAVQSPFYGGKEENYLGIPYPDYSENVKLEKESSGQLTGKYKYCVTFVNPNGWESAPGSLTEYEKSIVLSSNKVKITVTWNDSRVSYVKVYRTAAEGADFFCIAEIKASGENFVDDTDDYTLSGLEPLSTVDSYPPPDGGKYLCESGGVFFLAKGSTLYFSEVGNPHAWPPLNFIGFDDRITGITAEFQGVLVFTANDAFRVIGAEDVTTVTKTIIPGNQGCSNYNTIAKVSNAPIWLSNDGLCLWNGQSIALISKQVINTEKIQALCAASSNDKYYLFLKSGAVVFDHRNNDVFYRLDFTCEYAWYDADRDIMYLLHNNRILQYGFGDVGSYTYVSPLIGSPESKYHVFREIIISIDGQTSVKAKVDGAMVVTAQLPQAGKYRLAFPYDTVGRVAEITVSGSSSLKEFGVVYD